MRTGPDDQSETLARYRGFLIKYAQIIATSRPNDWQDLAQEGWVAMWRALKTYDPAKGSEASWLTTAARLRMDDVLRRQTWTGTLGARGHVREDPATPVDTSWEWTISEYQEHAYEAVLDGYHRGEINAALAQLDPKVRAWIEDRIMLDRNRYGWRTFVRQLDPVVRRQLAETLAHLDDM